MAVCVHSFVTVLRTRQRNRDNEPIRKSILDSLFSRLSLLLLPITTSTPRWRLGPSTTSRLTLRSTCVCSSWTRRRQSTKKDRWCGGFGVGVGGVGESCWVDGWVDGWVVIGSVACYFRETLSPTLTIVYCLLSKGTVAGSTWRHRAAKRSRWRWRLCSQSRRR
jgi:hypothetical protein